MKLIGLIIGLFSLMIFTTPIDNMTLVKEDLYFDNTEISNDDWRLFESELKKENLSTGLYRMENVFKVDAFNKSYYAHPAYSDYPVVGITKFGATEYCKWRNLNNKIDGTYRLPTKEEFLYVIAEGENSAKWNRKKLKFEKRGYMTSNFHETGSNSLTAHTKSSLPNKFGIYNIVGNVSELVQDENVAVGGSWRDVNDKKWDQVTQNFSGPQDWVGFRCVCELN